MKPRYARSSNFHRSVTDSVRSMERSLDVSSETRLQQLTANNNHKL